MTNFAAHRFPHLAPQDARPADLPSHSKAIGLTLSLIPLPVGELSVLLTAWLLILPV